jgi:hypothetical protein
VYADKTLGISEYSDPYTFVTTGEQPLNKPRFLQSDLTTSLNALIVNWSGLDYLGSVYPKSFDRVDIYVKGGDFGNTYVVAGSFKEAGKQTIIAQAGTYYVKLRAVSKLGTPSDFSDEWSANTDNPAEVIEPPTLPIGLTISTTAFGISVNWGGAYQANDPFSGFKTIQVYATTNAALGASTTTAFPSSALVSNLTVTQSLNRQNVGIDNLKQALGLTTSQEVYAANVYFYYIAYNKNNEPYKVAGVPTYTRISATPVSPTKANFIDLEDGTISIEKLVAGNGKFTSWLRTGSATGGSRIELNGGDDFADGTTGRQILDGLTVYDSGNVPIFRASHTDGTVSFGSFSPSEIAAIKANAESKTTLFRQTTAPTSLAIGDLWINTANTEIGRNTIYIATKVGANSIVSDPTLGWVVAKDLDINLALTKAEDANNKAGGFDSFGNINRAIQIASKAGSIYSVKSSYVDTTPGWFLGWDGILENSSPVIHIGNSNNHFKWTGSAIDVKGSFTTTGTQTLTGGGTSNLTATLSAGKLSLSSDQATGSMDWQNAAVLGVSSTDSKAVLSPAGLLIQHSDFAGLHIQYLPDDPYATIYMLSTPGPIFRWLNYQGGERAANVLGDTVNRPLVVTDQGVQYLGAQNYYGSASSATMSSATFGVDGDFYFSTNAN